MASMIYQGSETEYKHYIFFWTPFWKFETDQWDPDTGNQAGTSREKVLDY